MNAIILRNLMFAGIFLTFAAIAGFMYFASSYLREETTKTTHARIDAELSEQDIDRLRDLEKLLAAHKESAIKANQIVSASKEYQYQDQIVRDINAYAAQAGVSVIGYDFGETATSATPPPPTGSTPTTPIINGVKTLSVSLTLDSPMKFDNYLRFLKAIENNLTKMQVSGINLTPDTVDVNSISNPSVILMVYVR